jgi:hypothetical protein
VIYLYIEVFKQVLGPTKLPTGLLLEAVGLKCPGHENDNLLSARNEAKNEWSCNSNPP